MVISVSRVPMTTEGLSEVCVCVCAGSIICPYTLSTATALITGWYDVKQDSETYLHIAAAVAKEGTSGWTQQICSAGTDDCDATLSCESTFQSSWKPLKQCLSCSFFIDYTWGDSCHMRVTETGKHKRLLPRWNTFLYIRGFNQVESIIVLCLWSICTPIRWHFSL